MENNLPDTLKYIAVDELHTFDGAQGTDLACLLRRLKARLSVLPGQICCIGTSATMGAKDSAKSIREYAADVLVKYLMRMRSSLRIVCLQKSSLLDMM